jgi:hypothetical protein
MKPFRSLAARNSIDVDGLLAEQKQLQKLAAELQHKADANPALAVKKAQVLVDREARYMEREAEIRAQLIKLAAKHPEVGAANRERLETLSKGDASHGELVTAQAMISLDEIGPGLYRVDSHGFDAVLASHKQHGNHVEAVKIDPSTSLRSVTIRGRDGAQIHIKERLGAVGDRHPPAVSGESSAQPRPGLDAPHNRPTNRIPAQDVPPSERGTDRMPAVELPPSERPTLKMAAVEPEPTHAPDGSVRVVFMGSGDTAAEAARLIKPLPGYVDVIVHAEAGGFLLLHNGTWNSVKPNSIRQLILKNPAYGKGQAIRLIACESGSATSILAQSIADGMGAHVIAPNDKVWSHPDGRVTIGASHLENTGRWIPFEPRDVSASVDKARAPLDKPTEVDPAVHADESHDPASPADRDGHDPIAMGPQKRPPPADGGAGGSTTIKAAPEAEAVQQAIALAHGQLGKPIGEGGFGTVYRVPGHPDLAIKLPTNDAGGQLNAQLAKEAASLQRLSDAHLPTAYRGTVQWTDASGIKRVGILMEYVDGAFSKNVLQQGKFAGSDIPEGHRELFNQGTISDLVNLRDGCLEQNIDIEDLQFMVSNDGSIRVVDPARVTWLDEAKMKPRQIREQMKRFEKRINATINNVRDIVRKNTDGDH